MTATENQTEFGGDITPEALAAEAESAPCECYSCDGQCGGTAHPGWCGPTEEDAEGRPICVACREMAQAWGDHRTGLQAAVCQDRVRVQVKFGESCWLNPASARAFAVVLLGKAAELDRERAEAASAQASEFLSADDNTLERFDTEELVRTLAAALGMTLP